MTLEEVFQRFEREPEAYARIPTATYRLQLGPELTFTGARKIVPYLAALGISDCHLSPFLQPCSDESHGYDVADHGQLNTALGSEADYHALSATLQGHDMGQVMDVVPNHMGIAGQRNTWWTDVLENGRASAFASFFDVEWDPIKPELRDKVLLPLLGDQYGRVLESQELQLELQEGTFRIRYYDTVLPVAPRTYVAILEWRLDELQRALGPDHRYLLDLRSIITGLGHLPLQTEQAPARLEERRREKEVLKRRLAALVAASPEVRAFVDDNVRTYNGIKGDARSFDRLDDLLAAQAYRLSFWRTAGDEINYRRFFDINELAAIRMEEPLVFEAAHGLVFRLVRTGAVTGLRIDHPDGLFAPAHYLRDLQRRCFLERARYLRGREPDAAGEEPTDLEQAVLREFDRRVTEQDEADRADDVIDDTPRGLGLRRRWSAARARRGMLGAVQALLRRPAPADRLARAFYIVTEKILMPEEPLPARWPVAGTTGYEFLNAVNGLFVDPDGERRLTSTYGRFIGMRPDFAEVAYQSKRLVMDTTMASEIAMLGRRLGRISERRRSARDFTDRMLTEALREIVACFPVYRTYIGTNGAERAERDRRYVQDAVAEAQHRNPSVSTTIFEFIRELLCLDLSPGITDAERDEVLAFVGRFQQLTGPFTAKGVEDTAFYRYHRLISLNEVGGRPDVFGSSLEEFHQRCLARLTRWPAAISVLSTHDTKRSADVRARINVLSEIPQEWTARVRAWQQINRGKKRRVDGQPAPDGNEEYLLYQTLLGAWPMTPADPAEQGVFVERIYQYMRKALREAKVNVSWINPRREYDAAIRGFIEALLDESRPNEFLDDFRPFQARVAELGIYNSLSQTVLQLTAPGVPELYQGSELWELSLVDPDNRRLVDFDRAHALLAELRGRTEAENADLPGLTRTLVDARQDGRIKLYVIQRALTYRRSRPRLFLRGRYVPLDVTGDRCRHVCAFARSHDEDDLVVVVPRWLSRLIGRGAPLGSAVWGENAVMLPAGAERSSYRNLFTGEVVDTAERDRRRTLPLATVFSTFPVAVLERIKAG